MKKRSRNRAFPSETQTVADIKQYYRSPVMAPSGVGAAILIVANKTMIDGFGGKQ